MKSFKHVQIVLMSTTRNQLLKLFSSSSLVTLVANTKTWSSSQYIRNCGGVFWSFWFQRLNMSMLSTCNKVLTIWLIYISRIDKIIKFTWNNAATFNTEISLAVKKNDSFLWNGLKINNNHFKFALIFLWKLL